MAPIQSRSMRCQAVYRQCGRKEGNIQPLLQSEYRFCLLLQEQSGFQHLQSKVRHDSEKCRVLHPNFHRVIDRFLRWSQNSLYRDCVG